jgi:hypothetical protein
MTEQIKIKRSKSAFTAESVRRAYERETQEHEHQKTVIQWRNTEGARLPGIERLHAIPNGGKRSTAVAAKLKAEGALEGVSDLFLPHPERGYHGLYIEVKRIGRRATPEQVKFLYGVAAEGYCAFECQGANATIETLRWYYGLRDTLPPRAKQFFADVNV